MDTQDRPFPAGYREYLEAKVETFAREWAEKSPKTLGNGGYLGMGDAKIVRYRLSKRSSLRSPARTGFCTARRGACEKR